MTEAGEREKARARNDTTGGFRRLAVRIGLAAVETARHPHPHGPGASTERVDAACEMILAAGAVGSPHVLQLSGVGEPEMLSKAGISVHHVLPGVGRNFQDHYCSRFRVGVKPPFNCLFIGPQMADPWQIHVPNHLILPFGTARKFDLNRIRLSSAGANGIYFTSDIPCIYIDRSNKTPLRMRDYYSALNPTTPCPDSNDIEVGLNYIADLIRQYMPDATRFQAMFLNSYFEWIKRNVDSRIALREVNPYSVYNAPLPIPEMQVYVNDPLEDDWTVFEPTNNFRVDFGFWTGTQLVAVEIDGNEPAGYASDVRRDRLSRRAEVDVIHILNTEIELHQRIVISELLPTSITRDWLKVKDPYCPFTFTRR